MAVSVIKPKTAVTKPAPAPASADLETLEMRLLLEAAAQATGFDLRDYDPVTLSRKLDQAMRAEKTTTLSGLQEKLLHDPECRRRFVAAMTTTPSAMFRVPALFAALRARVFPWLRTYPFLRIWHAGCASGEETYSLAIALLEAGLYERCKIYATHVSDALIETARAGAYSARTLKDAEGSYRAAGGTHALADYYTIEGDHVRWQHAVTQNIVWAVHNLASDASFNEFHLIICRNVLSQYNRALQSRVHTLFVDSLIRLGFLALGDDETLRYSAYERRFEMLTEGDSIYRRIR